MKGRRPGGQTFTLSVETRTGGSPSEFSGKLQGFEWLAGESAGEVYRSAVRIARRPRRIGHYNVWMRFSFAEFVLDGSRHELLRGQDPVHLSPKAFSLLEALLTAAPEAVQKDELYRALWGETFVDETNIANLVSELRAALGDDSRNPRFIRTLHRYGYRFEGDAAVDQTPQRKSSAPGRSWLVWVSRDFPLVEGENILGRDPAAEVWIDSASISRRHARLTLADCATLEDLESKNGTFVGDERIVAPVEIHDGDTIGLGSIRLTFRTLKDPRTTLTEAKPLSGE